MQRIHFANQRAMPSRRADGTEITPLDGGPDVRCREDLCAVLIVAARTPSLDGDVRKMGLRWESLGNGYHRLVGGRFAAYVVEIDVVAIAEGDEVLHSFGHGAMSSPEAQRFWMELLGSKESAMGIEETEGYEDLVRRVLAGIPADLRLAGLPPEQRLAGLDRDHQGLALPVEVLRMLPDEYLRSLSPEVEAELRRRLRSGGH